MKKEIVRDYNPMAVSDEDWEKNIKWRDDLLPLIDKEHIFSNWCWKNTILLVTILSVIILECLQKFWTLKIVLSLRGISKRVEPLTSNAARRESYKNMSEENKQFNCSDCHEVNFETFHCCDNGECEHIQGEIKTGKSKTMNAISGRGLYENRR